MHVRRALDFNLWGREYDLTLLKLSCCRFYLGCSHVSLMIYTVSGEQLMGGQQIKGKA